MARSPVMAAGGIVLQQGQTPLVAVVRLRKRNEWVLPKGKLDDGETPRAAAERVTQIGPVSRLIRESGAEHLPAILDAVERSLAPLAAADGEVSLSGSSWIVSAMNPG